MKNPLTLLVVEDRPNHMQDLTTMLEAELPRLPIQVDVLYAQDLEEALQLLHRADIVMTDVFFPAGPGEPEKPNGKVIVERCLTEQKPVVWVTSTYHHGRSTNDVSEWGREHGLEMFDVYEAGNGEAPHKPWMEGLYGLLYLSFCIEEGYCLIQDGKLLGPERSWSGAPKRYPFGTEFHVGTEELLSGQGVSAEDFPVLVKMIKMGFTRP